MKSIDKENPDSKALNTLALGWLFNKRSFSVSGKFKELLSDLIKNKHNSNQKLKQVTLRREIIQDFQFHILGFVSADEIRLKDKFWFIKLDNEQCKLLEQIISTDFNRVYEEKIFIV